MAPVLRLCLLVRLLAAVAAWLAVPPGAAGVRFPWGHFLLRSILFGSAWWWFVGGAYDSLAAGAFSSACSGAGFGLFTLAASAMHADSRGRI